jgi:hypothetical protein
LQEILFGRKIGRLKKQKREVRYAKQGSDRPGVAAAPGSLASAGLANNKLDRPPSRKLSGVVLMQMLAVRGQ